MDEPYLTVIESRVFQAKATRLLTEAQRLEIVTLVAKNPEVGAVMAGTGGVRKFRYAAKEGKGKSGGARIIYLLLAHAGRIHLLDIFTKNEKGNLSKAERNEMAKLSRLMKGE